MVRLGLTRALQLLEAT
ncbi:hypothetical protein Golob_006159 [Gossypium lobatum]|uniref:Uncharacterized protein n=1 Tax=Gossypium lobatum TaxID=34289 RepID=A0A7J8MVK6_9ROSI|nr:hypothetical protein [Gossypium lobatum]